MKKLNLIKVLILVMTVLFSTDKAFCEATAVQSSETVVQPTVAVEKVSSVETGNINPSSGSASELISSFKLQSNDESTFFVVYSTLTAAGEATVSAFDSKGNLLFANSQYPPSIEAVNNAKQGIAGNANVIAYKISLSGEGIDIAFVNSSTYKECYKISLKESITNGLLEQTVGGAPATNTYQAGQDMAGSYKATVYVTAATEL